MNRSFSGVLKKAHQSVFDGNTRKVGYQNISFAVSDSMTEVRLMDKLKKTNGRSLERNTNVSCRVSGFSGALLFAFILSQFQLFAVDYYVSTNGNNGNSGTKDQPWRTIQNAANLMVAGDTVTIENGKYSEVVTTRANGIESKPIRFVALDNVAAGGFIIANRWIEITGFYFNGANVGTSDGIVRLSKGAENFILRSNTFNLPYTNYVTVSHVFAESACTNGWFEGNRFLNTTYGGVVVNGRGHVLTNNYWSNTNGGDALRILGSDIVVTRNIFTNWSDLTEVSPQHPDLIQTFTGGGEVITNVIIEGNLFIDCVAQIGNMEDQDQKGKVGWWTWRNNIWNNVSYIMSICPHDIYFYNNLFYRSGTNSGHPINFRDIPGRGIGSNGVVLNNLFIECGSNPGNPDRGWFSLEGLATNGFVVGSNLVAGVFPAIMKRTGADYWLPKFGFNGKIPMFVDAAHGDFRLQSNSVCIGAGIQLSNIFTNDFLGFARGLRWDIGPNHYQGVPSNKIAPPGFVFLMAQSPSDDEDLQMAGRQVLAGNTYTYRGGNHRNLTIAEWRWVYSRNGAPDIVFKRGTGPVEEAVYQYPFDASGDSYVWRLLIDAGGGMKSSSPWEVIVN